MYKESLPAWECGLKFPSWLYSNCPDQVTPCVGVWIEIANARNASHRSVSLPAWECGLK